MVFNFEITILLQFQTYYTTIRQVLSIGSTYEISCIYILYICDLYKK